MRFRRYRGLPFLALALLCGAVLSADKGKKEPETHKPASVVVKEKPAIEMMQSKPAAGEQINWQVISSGGSGGVSMGYQHTGTACQTAVRSGSSPNYRLASGFWPDFGTSGCCIDPTGNVDCDPTDMVDLGDLTRLIDYLFISFEPLCCEEEAEMDYNPADPVCSVDLGDLTRMIDYLFISFDPLPPCCKCCPL